MRYVLGLISDGLMAVGAVLYCLVMLHTLAPGAYHKLIARLQAAWEQAVDEYRRVFGILTVSDKWDELLNENNNPA